MSNVSIYEKNWIDLVFEDKNKAYGAYQLRQENEKTTLFALFGGVTMVLATIGIWMFLSSFGEKPLVEPVDDSIVIKVSDFNYPNDEPEKPKTETTQPQNPVEIITNLSNIIPVATPLAIDNVPKNADLPTNNGTSSGTDSGTGTPSDGGGSTGTAVIPAVPDNNPKRITELDRLPEYPGGMKRFYEFVGNNFEKPDVDENFSSLNVIMSFVIEKDGSMTEIKALRSSDKFMEREAIRVLKSMKIKWSPGYKDGEKVRVLYTLPIKVAL